MNDNNNDDDDDDNNGWPATRVVRVRQALAQRLATIEAATNDADAALRAVARLNHNTYARRLHNLSSTHLNLSHIYMCVLLLLVPMDRLYARHWPSCATTLPSGVSSIERRVSPCASVAPRLNLFAAAITARPPLVVRWYLGWPIAIVEHVIERFFRFVFRFLLL
jgi:hypothetical protein